VCWTMAREDAVALGLGEARMNNQVFNFP
jgi:hypothetical protein